ncbi:CDP-diacylglycerol--glycerol-3-phosphate 3-phosphatidyltransferase [Texas Phoenix palm phytoplasma]|uniref:CDP-diacylglycerol--glycerol-3-phosphate 3-phosphatidyltransferase n=1 Tax=Texas Phoenix palm phytoplasma TaxID=176709 RepID=A0ABS5BKC5_9MOLU|nr:CDP-alcohol phosphatidyltransferase family protein [Texas Phoenix palm phytoplasma]MBP3059217.1 CDP-diacylglycerol--glycerol-3-phosphate 3-phosphatidyltransferase [Texas Phoenix palm phytoplasma]
MKKLIKISANLITIFRIFLVFCLLPFLYLKYEKKITNDLNAFKLFKFWFAMIFILASITDFLDGYIAKKFKQQTIFGKFFDPIADKLLVIISFFYLYILCKNKVLLNDYKNNKNLEYFIISVLIVNIIRDFLIMGVRLIAFEQKNIISASFLGKTKTFFTFFSIILLLFADTIEKYSNNIMFFQINIMNILKFFLTMNIILIIISGLEYIMKNFKIILINLYKKK